MYLSKKLSNFLIILCKINLYLRLKIIEQLYYQIVENGLGINQCEFEFNLSVIILIYPQRNTKLSGLYRSSGKFLYIM